ncbi:NAD(P)-dependent alcohol dehydrogenase [Moorella sulfitireducens (nom. illeg.)]|uniref:NAD(P)-dependent alcohol dehydrogenase n=1 Tax=Neomoorella sulfitireducens TaxID=2972948 RepID=UPI0021AC68B3|nr:NAD(P)-dependent alcohol dehydrogenase [Moorella sulfitireducens]
MKITAALLREKNGPFSIEEVEIDEPREDEILVKIMGSGLCHTDLFISYILPFAPFVVGHEGAGIVEKVGAKVKKVKPGDKVVLSFRTCGTCVFCLSGQPAYCLNFPRFNSTGRRPDGSTTMKNADGPVYGNFFGQSSFASYALTIEQNTIKVPDDVPLEILGPFGCSVQTGAGAVINTFAAKAGSSIAVFGVGAVGLSGIMAAKIVGCTTIIAVDVFDNRLALAKELGATHTINSKEADPVKTIREITGLGVDYALDCTGVPAVAKQAVESTHIKGTTGIVGLAHGKPLELDYASVQCGRTVKGVMEGDAVPDLFIPKMVELYKQGKLPFDKFIKKYALKDINQAVDDVHHGTTIKPILIP